MTKSSAKAASREATIRSQPNARLQPAPAAMPVTFAMVGFVHSTNERTVWSMRRIRSLNSNESADMLAGSPRSAPEQNAPPAPVTTTHRTESSADA